MERFKAFGAIYSLNGACRGDSPLSSSGGATWSSATCRMDRCSLRLARPGPASGRTATCSNGRLRATSGSYSLMGVAPRVRTAPRSGASICLLRPLATRPPSSARALAARGAARAMAPIAEWSSLRHTQDLAEDAPRRVALPRPPSPSLATRKPQHVGPSRQEASRGMDSPRSRARSSSGPPPCTRSAPRFPLRAEAPARRLVSAPPLRAHPRAADQRHARRARDVPGAAPPRSLPSRPLPGPSPPTRAGPSPEIPAGGSRTAPRRPRCACARSHRWPSGPRSPAPRSRGCRGSGCSPG